MKCYSININNHTVLCIGGTLTNLLSLERSPICLIIRASRLRSFKILTFKMLEHETRPSFKPRVASFVRISPANNCSIFQNGRKGTPRRMNLKHIFQLFIHFSGVTTTCRFTPSDDAAIIA